MDPRYLAIIPSVFVIAALGVGFTVRSFLRGRSLPQCWRCGTSKVRRSRADGFIDAAAAMILLRPFRCTGCRARFYAPRFLEPMPLKKRPRASAARGPAHSPVAHLQTQNQA